MRDKTGMTKVGDLSPADMKKVRRLVLIEVSALFDTVSIDLKTHKALKIKVKGQSRAENFYSIPCLVFCHIALKGK